MEIIDENMLPQHRIVLKCFKIDLNMGQRAIVLYYDTNLHTDPWCVLLSVKAHFLIVTINELTSPQFLMQVKQNFTNK